MSPTVAKSSITATSYSRFSAEINNPAPTASTATPAATLPGFSLVKVLALSVELFKYSRAVLRYSSMSTFCICVRRLLIISSLMPSLPRNCSRPLLPPKAWPHCGQTPLPGDFIGVVSLEVMPVGPAPVIGVSMVVVLLSVAPGAVLARLVRASVRADTRVAGLVREAVLVVPAILGDDVVLVALAIGAARAERALQARLRRRIRVADDVERHVGLQAAGGPGLSVAFDLPTLMGRDPDDPLSLGEVGKCGVNVTTLADMEALFDGISLGEITTSMTINAPAP